jgi:hypothetical protein
MSVLFNHGLRHELLDRNPVQWVRQSAKRKKIPAVVEIEEVHSLVGALDLRERTMVLLDVVTGLRASELFGLKWSDINFNKNEISVTRSIVMQVVGSCKTEASQKPVPLDPLLANTLRNWRAHTRYKAATDWVFASPYSQGRKPYWCQSLMRNRISVVARHVGITKKIGWHSSATPAQRSCARPDMNDGEIQVNLDGPGHRALRPHTDRSLSDNCSRLRQRAPRRAERQVVGRHGQFAGDKEPAATFLGRHAQRSMRVTIVGCCVGVGQLFLVSIPHALHSQWVKNVHVQEFHQLPAAHFFHNHPGDQGVCVGVLPLATGIEVEEFLAQVSTICCAVWGFSIGVIFARLLIKREGVNIVA